MTAAISPIASHLNPCTCRHGSSCRASRGRWRAYALALMGTLGLAVGQASAALVYYDINDAGVNADPLGAETVEAGVGASNLSLTGMLYSGGSKTVFVQGQNATTTTGVNYISFTLSALNPEETLSISSVSFGHYYDGTGALGVDWHWDLQANIDSGGFIDVGANPDATYNLDIDGPMGTVKHSAVLLDITGATTVEFRLSTYHGGSGGNSVYYSKTQSITVDGAVIPEPGSLAIAGLGGLCVLVGRRRRHHA